MVLFMREINKGSLPLGNNLLIKPKTIVKYLMGEGMGRFKAERPSVIKDPEMESE